MDRHLSGIGLAPPHRHDLRAVLPVDPRGRQARLEQREKSGLRGLVSTGGRDGERCATVTAVASTATPGLARRPYRSRRAIGLLSVCTTSPERGLIPEQADVCPSRNLTRFTSRHLLGELLELTLLPSTAQRATG
jgi:hypothetical protein